MKWEDEGVVCRSGVESGVDKRSGGVGERMVFRSGVEVWHEGEVYKNGGRRSEEKEWRRELSR